MQTITSRDGTTLAYQRSGDGPALVFVPGVFNDHTRCAPLAAELRSDHTTVVYDRRGRGRSGYTGPYSIDREVDDLSTLIDHLGGGATVFGYSSGGVLALKAAADGAPISRLVVFEAPWSFGRDVDPTVPATLAGLIADGRPGDAVALFQTRVIGLPEETVAHIRQSPMWPALESMAPSMVHDATITTELAEPTPAMTAVTVPTLIMTGERTWPALREAAQTLAKLMPQASYAEVDAENHDIPPAATAAAIRRFEAS